MKLFFLIFSVFSAIVLIHGKFSIHPNQNKIILWVQVQYDFMPCYAFKWVFCGFRSHDIETKHIFYRIMNIFKFTCCEFQPQIYFTTIIEQTIFIHKFNIQDGFKKPTHGIFHWAEVVRCLISFWKIFFATFVHYLAADLMISKKNLA